MVLGVAILAAAIVFVAVLGFSVVSRTSASARAQVHVDDLVIGRLPPVCAITGEPTTELVEVESSRGGFQPWWLLLLFLGPLGIAAIAVLYVLGGRVERVSGTLPVSPAALAHYNAAVSVAQRTAIALAVLVVGGFAGLLLLDFRSSLPALVVAGLAVLCVIVLLGANAVAPSRWIDLSLDGSGRWVTVERAHPKFAEAVRQQYLAREPTRG